MALFNYPSRFISSLPPKDGNAYRILWQRPSSLARMLSTLCYTPVGWEIRNAEGRWIGFPHLDAVLAHKPQALAKEASMPMFNPGDVVKLRSGGSPMSVKTIDRDTVTTS